MIPRLVPRPSKRSSLSAGEEENTSPFLPTSKSNESSSPANATNLDFFGSDFDISSDEGETPSPSPPPSRPRPNAASRRALADKGSAANAPLSPSPGMVHMESLKSPVSSDSWSDGSSDYSITPPMPGPRPLVVSAKRVGQDVRQKHSKRRRCRSRRGDSKANNGFCLWKDPGTEKATPPPNSSDDDDDDDEDIESLQESLLFLKNVSPTEQRRHYWELCYGNQKVESIQNNGWSATRRPPSKGCLSNSQYRVKPSIQTDFKTPPASPEEWEDLRSPRQKKNCRVQFGSPTAMEYEVDGPAGQLTPLPSEVAKKRYSMDLKERTQEEEDITQETKDNTAVLAEWEEEFSEPKSTSRSRRKNKNRRSSSIFSPKTMLDDEETEGGIPCSSPPRETSKVPESSPSELVTKNLASLRMSSPDVGNVSAEVESVSSADRDSSFEVPTYESSSPANKVELWIDIKPAAPTIEIPDNSPQFGPCGTPQRSANVSTPVQAKKAETTPPNTNISLETIHSFGGALDLESPSTSVHSSPGVDESTSPPSLAGLENTMDMTRHSLVRRMSDEAETENSFEAANRAEHIEIYKALLMNPGADQEWEPISVFRTLGRRWSLSETEKVLKAIDFKQNGVLSCADDLIEEAKYSANGKTKLDNPEAVATQRTLSREWMVLETQFFVSLEKVLRQSLDTRADICEKVAKLPVPTDSRTNVKILRKEIAALEAKILLEQQRQQIAEALEGPLSSLRCQASSFVGISGFRMDECSGSSFRLSFEHIISGLETRFLFDFETGAVSLSRATCPGPTVWQPVSLSSEAAKFHEQFLKLFVDGHLWDYGNCEPNQLQDRIQEASGWLGRLDVAAIELDHMTKEYAVTIEFPFVKFTYPSGDWTKVCYDGVRHLRDEIFPTSICTSQSEPKFDKVMGASRSLRDIIANAS